MLKHPAGITICWNSMCTEHTIMIQSAHLHRFLWIHLNVTLLPLRDAGTYHQSLSNESSSWKCHFLTRLLGDFIYLAPLKSRHLGLIQVQSYLAYWQPPPEEDPGFSQGGAGKIEPRRVKCHTLWQVHVIWWIRGRGAFCGLYLPIGFYVHTMQGYNNPICWMPSIRQ